MRDADGDGRSGSDVVPAAAAGEQRRRLKNNLTALGSVAVLAVYAAGYWRTREAAAAFTAHQRGASGGAKAHRDSVPVVRVAGGSEVRKAARATTVDSVVLETVKPILIHTARPDTVETDSTTNTVGAAPETNTTSHAADFGYTDGLYTGYGTSREGDIEMLIEVKHGRVVSATISQCLTRYSCSWIDPLPKQVLERQSSDVDYVSGATESSNAFIIAVAEALAKAQ